jgi:hypothetical protein
LPAFPPPPSFSPAAFAGPPSAWNVFAPSPQPLQLFTKSYAS